MNITIGLFPTHHFGALTPDTLKPFPKNPSICKFMIQIGRFDELGSGMRNLAKYLPTPKRARLAR